MSGLYEVLQKIKPRPGMYIGRESVSDLFHFLVGYEFARGELDIEPTEWENDFHENFQPWVQNKYHVSTSNSWAKIIMLHCGSEKEGLDVFYKLLDEFKNRDKKLDKEVAKEEGFSLESTPDDEHQKNELIKQLSETEAVVWSPQTDNQGIQALSELLIAEQRKSNA